MSFLPVLGSVVVALAIWVPLIALYGDHPFRRRRR
jgi:hypothetical protein